MNRVKLEIKEKIAVITIDNEKKINCITTKMLEELLENVELCNTNPDISCVIITGTGKKAFTSGGDLKSEMKYATSDHKNIDKYNRLGINLVKNIMNSPKVYIAAVNGYALGAALGVITACDIAIGSDNSVYGLPTTSLGGIPGWGCTQQVTRTVGKQWAMRMLFLNEKLDAQKAKECNLISEIIPVDLLVDRAFELAQRIMQCPQNTIKATKQCVNRGLENTLEDGLELEARLLYETNTHYNFGEGIQAFLEKRKPEFIINLP